MAKKKKISRDSKKFLLLVIVSPVSDDDVIRTSTSFSTASNYDDQQIIHPSQPTSFNGISFRKLETEGCS